IEEEREELEREKEELRSEREKVEEKKKELDEEKERLGESKKEVQREKEELLGFKEDSEVTAENILESFEGERKSTSKINKQFIRDFFRIWMRFQKVDAHMSMHPDPSAFAEFIDYPENWKFKDDFDISKLKMIKLANKSQYEIGPKTEDSLMLEYHQEDDDLAIELFFEYCEENKYSRALGWGKSVSRYSLFKGKVPLQDEEMGEFHERLKDFVKKWYEAHLTKHRDLVLNYVENKYEKVEGYIG
ncbi:MAG: hypothetical protein ACOC55_05965, partial [Candidatus Natronoplasma sp.]